VIETDENGIARKSLGAERTFAAVSSPEDLKQKLYELSEIVSQDLKSESLLAKTITLKLKTVNFELLTRSNTLTKYIQESSDIFEHGFKLLEKLLPINIRLMGVCMSKLKSEYEKAGDNHRGSIDYFFQQQNAVNNERSEQAKHIKSMNQDQILGDKLLCNDHEPLTTARDGHDLYDDMSDGCNDDETRAGLATVKIKKIATSPVGFQEQVKKRKHDDPKEDLETDVIGNVRLHHSRICRSHLPHDKGGDITAVAENKTLIGSPLKSAASPSSNSVTSNPNIFSHKTQYCCPVCGLDIYGTVIALNLHIDQCLSTESKPTSQDFLSHFKRPKTIKGFYP
jgi:hypothetical protein